MPPLRQVLQNTAVVFAGLVLAGLFAGCERPDDLAEIKREARKTSTPFTKRMQYSVDCYLGEYLTNAPMNPAWHFAGTNGLADLAKAMVLEEPFNEAPLRSAGKQLQEAVSAGCEDALVFYGAVFAKHPHAVHANAEAAAAYVQAANRIRNSNYSETHRFWATINAAQALKAANKKPPQEVYNLRTEAMASSMSVVQMKEAPVEEVYKVCWTMMDSMRNNPALKDNGALLAEAMEVNWPREPQTWLLRGEYEIAMAWRSRGNGWASEVTEEGWAGFHDHLHKAEKALEKSWSIRSSERAALLMMDVELGLGKNRARMEKNFLRAMHLNPNSWDAASKKLQYLYPRWHGSAQEMVKFGWECVTSTNWGGKVPLILMYAHEDAAKSLHPKWEGQTKYYRSPGVWEGIEASFEKFFELNPEAISWRHNYFWFAWRCGAWKRAEEQIKYLAPVNYDYFGGKESFEEMVKEVREKSGPGRDRKSAAAGA